MNDIMIDRVQVSGNRVDYHFSPSKSLQRFFNRNTAFIEFDMDMADVPESILVIPFVSSILAVIWATNSILWVRDLDRTFYDTLPMIRAAFGELYQTDDLRGTVVAAKTTQNNNEPDNGTVLLFSGGIDSHASFIRYKNQVPVLLNVQGFYQGQLSDSPVYDADKRDIEAFALRQGCHAHFVRCNFATLLSNCAFGPYARKFGRNLWGGFVHGPMFISSAMVLAYRLGLNQVVIASSHTMGFRKPCASDPTTDIQFRAAGAISTVHDGFELRRQDKVKLIVDHQRESNQPYPLRVCSFNTHNCCHCEKCFRSMLGIVALGGDIKQFDFHIEDSLLDHFQKYFHDSLYAFPLETEQVYWDQIKVSIQDNQAKIKEKSFIEWFLSYDFYGGRRKALIAYRLKNFPALVGNRISRLAKKIRKASQ